MKQPEQANTLRSWALYPHGIFSGSRLQTGFIVMGSVLFFATGLCVSIENDAAYGRDTAILQKAANEDGFSLVDRARISGTQATVALQFGRCVFDNTIVTISDGHISAYDIFVGGDSYHRNEPGVSHFAPIRNSGDMPPLTTTDVTRQVVPCISE